MQPKYNCQLKINKTKNDPSNMTKKIFWAFKLIKLYLKNCQKIIKCVLNKAFLPFFINKQLLLQLDASTEANPFNYGSVNFFLDFYG